MRTFFAMRTACAVLLAVTLGATRASAIAVTAGSPSGIGGQLVDVDVTVPSVTGLNILSYQFGVTFNGAVVSVNSVVETGTLSGTAGWGPATYATGTGTLSVSHAGTTPLSGSGTLIHLRFLINPAQLTATSTGINFTNFTFNEGTPTATTTNGSITINATPIITVSPNTGVVVRTQTLSFNVSGTVSAPVTWGTTNPSVATITSAGVLTGVAPGFVKVFAVDNASRRDTTDGLIEVRGMTVAVGSTTVPFGQPVSIPVTTTSLNGLGIRSGQFRFTFNPAILTPVDATTPGGTLLNGYGSFLFGTGGGPGTFDVAFAGTTDLTGTGTLFNLNFTTPGSGSTTVSPFTALFNETLPAVTTSGNVTVNGLPVLTVSPSTITLLATQTQTFTASGTVSPPVTWSTLDPSVATIDPSTGVLTAVAGGVTRVKAVDNVGAIGLNTSVTVYDFTATMGSASVAQGAYVTVPITLDRNVNTLNIRSLQYTLQFTPTWVLSAHAEQAGLETIWGSPTQSQLSDRVSVAAAGTQALKTGTMLNSITFHVSPSAPVSTVIPLTLTVLILNEGLPTPLVSNGSLTVTTGSAATPPGGLSFALEPPAPNPAGSRTHITFTLPGGDGAAAAVRLAVYSLDGRRVRTLIDRVLDPGRHELSWDVSDDTGHPLSAGLYFCRLDRAGTSRTRRLAVVR